MDKPKLMRMEDVSRDAWDQERGVVKTRPPIDKIEVWLVPGDQVQVAFNAQYWADGRMHMVHGFVNRPQRLRDAIYEALERDWWRSATVDGE